VRPSAANIRRKHYADLFLGVLWVGDRLSGRLNAIEDVLNKSLLPSRSRAAVRGFDVWMRVAHLNFDTHGITPSNQRLAIRFQSWQIPATARRKGRAPSSHRGPAIAHPARAL
jgi:hypothetical protein